MKESRGSALLCLVDTHPFHMDHAKVQLKRMPLAHVQREYALDVLTGWHVRKMQQLKMVLDSAIGRRMTAMQLNRIHSLARVQRRQGALDVLTGIHVIPLLESAMMHPRETTAETEIDVCSPSPGGQISWAITNALQAQARRTERDRELGGRMRVVGDVCCPQQR